MKKIFVVVFVCFASLLFAQDDNQQLSKQSNLSMFQPITVTIGGDFIVTGSFTAYRSERLDHFITKVFTEAESNMRSGLNQIDMIKKVTSQIEKYAKRDITLKHRNGETVKIDLLKFHLTGDMSNNPYLMDDDVIIFPSYDDERSVVEISGAVNKPTKFQFVDGDKLSDAILFAGGINPAYDNVTTAEISRLSNDGNKENIIDVPIKDDYKLQIGDRIRVLFKDNNKKTYKALVLGEVRTPGYVYLTKDNTTIKDVIAKAGGFTDKAWLERSELLRGTSEVNVLKMKAIRDEFEKDRNFNTILTEKYLNDVFIEQMKMLRMNDMYMEDSAAVAVDNTLRVLQSKSIIDFTKINSDTTTESKYVVQDGDIIVIPQREDLVYVFGQVRNPGYVEYVPQKSDKYYINKAGGLGERAESEVKIIKGGSYAWITADSDSKIDPGDFIYVPKNVPKPFEYYMRTLGYVSTVVTAVATVILIVVQAKK